MCYLCCSVSIIYFTYVSVVLSVVFCRRQMINSCDIFSVVVLSLTASAISCLIIIHVNDMYNN